MSAVNAMENDFTLSETPNQPRLVSFPFGKSSKRRSVQSSWFDKGPWLHWNDSLGSVFCLVCLRASKAGSKSCDQALISRGSKNWHNATRMFRSHEHSLNHKEAIEQMVTLPSTTHDIGELLSSSLIEERKTIHCIIVRCFFTFLMD